MARAGSVRSRTTIAAVLAVGIALVIASAAMVFLLGRSLTDDVRAAATLRGQTVAAELEPADREVHGGDAEEEFVQVIDDRGRVIASSPNVAVESPLAQLAAGEELGMDEVPFEDDPFLVVAVPASTSDGAVKVLVGRTLDGVTESTQTVVALLVLGVPLMLVVVGFVTWRMTGTALSPVDAMRAEVDGISSSALHRRVPVPDGSDEIARLATTMNGMLARLEDAQKRQHRFVSDASHELRSPISSIRQHVEVTMKHPEEASVAELAEVVGLENERLQLLVEDLLFLAQGDEASGPLAVTDVDLDDIVFEEAERLRRSWTSIEIDTTRVSGGRIVGNAGRLSRLVGNLLDNAVRHARSRVATSLNEAEGGVVLVVEDDGDGIPAQERERIFERFERLDEARDRDSGGAGLGLAIVAEVAAAHAAEIEIGDRDGGGARFEVRFGAFSRGSAVS